MTTLVNLTPHAVVLRNEKYLSLDVTIPPSGTVARVTSTPGEVTMEAVSAVEADGCFSCFSFDVAGPTVFGAVEGLPPPSPGKGYIVSALVGAALAGSRPDVFMPGTGPADGAVRNEKGHIVAVTRLVRAA